MSGFDELRQFAQDLGRVAGGAYPEVDAVIKKGAQNIKDDLVAAARASRHFKGMAGSISYEHQNTPSVIRREIGPDKARKGGALGNIYYFGTSRGGGTGDLEGPLRREEPNLERELGKVVEKWAGEL